MAKSKPVAAFEVAKRMSRPLDRLAWMLEFIRLKFESVAALEDAELAEVQNQILAFVTAQLGSPVFSTTQIRRLSREDIWNLRSRLQEQVRSFASGSPAGWKNDGLPQRLTRDETGAIHVRPDSADVQGIFFDCAFALARAEGARIIKCARHNCDNFLVREGRSTYCSKRCSQYVRTMKWRHTEPQEITNG